MPAKSKSQQRFFALVHGIKTGKIKPGKVSSAVKKAAKTISTQSARDYAATKHDSLPELHERVKSSPKFIEGLLREIAETGTPAYVGGTLVDVFTANMLTTTLENLNEENKQQMLGRPLNEMVALSYKLLTY